MLVGQYTRYWKLTAALFALGVFCGFSFFTVAESFASSDSAPISTGALSKSSARPATVLTSPQALEIPALPEGGQASTSARSNNSSAKVSARPNSDIELKRALDRNRRLEALVQVLRQREAARLQERPSGDGNRWGDGH